MEMNFCNHRRDCGSRFLKICGTSSFLGPGSFVYSLGGLKTPQLRELLSFCLRCRKLRELEVKTQKRSLFQTENII